MSKVGKTTQAAAVILLRGAEAKGFEVFLTRHAEGRSLLGGTYGYPGATVSKQDYAAQMLERCSGLTPKQARQELGAHFSPGQAMGLWVAGVRAVFENIGVLLALEESGAPLRPEGIRAARLFEKHTALRTQSMSFAAIFESEKLLCDLASLRHFSHWQIAAQLPMHFDTHFFVAPLPEGQMTLGLSDNAAHGVWLPPERAMQLFNRSDLPMSFPTFAALRTLADFDTLERVLRDYGVDK